MPPPSPPDPPDTIPLPVTIPPARLTKALREQIEREVAAVVPPGKRFAVLGVYDHDNRVLTGGMAMRLTPKDGDTGPSWSLSAEFSKTLDDKGMSGRIAVIGAF